MGRCYAPSRPSPGLFRLTPQWTWTSATLGLVIAAGLWVFSPVEAQATAIDCDTVAASSDPCDIRRPTDAWSSTPALRARHLAITEEFLQGDTITPVPDQLPTVGPELSDAETRLMADIASASHVFDGRNGGVARLDDHTTAGSRVIHARSDLNGDFLSKVRTEILSRVPDELGDGIRAAEGVIEKGAEKLDAGPGTGRAMTPAILGMLVAGIAGGGMFYWRKRAQSARRRKRKQRRKGHADGPIVDPGFEDALADPMSVADFGPQLLKRRVAT